ncbi:hypothetical protein FJ941_20950 [Mesorhizobium sp. B2-3-13]|uniref:hypothetical protein n=1 Tax=Mesorhizobium sp. B2-3-13 TaxID=2589951 RepID=UPI00112E5785|nr:hypothetical protein [Mesorhizobium sp. B2-3-13]TPL79105.1 hypothetical protein FJ941_20950 [Mesorhizobium sp. B2-3-13]
MGFLALVAMMFGLVALIFLAMRIIPGHGPHQGEFAPKSKSGVIVSLIAVAILFVLIVASLLRTFR